jgi:nucleoside-triphosphatase
VSTPHRTHSSEATAKLVYLLTGRPGTGKTSLIKTALAGLPVRAGGFYTEEIRREGTRLGFRLVTLDGQEAVLAHIDFSKRFRVGKYGVDVAALEKVGVAALKTAAGECDLTVVDEIGRMELLSPEFREAVTELINGGKRVLGTIMLQPNPFADAIKRHPNVWLVTLTRENHRQAFEDVRGWLKTIQCHSEGAKRP